MFGLAVGACGDDASFHLLPVFEGGAGIANASEAGDAASKPDVATNSDGQVSETSTNDSATDDDAATTATNLVISQVQSRGTAGGNDEFVELYNPTDAAITFDGTWTITVRNATSGVAACAGAPSILYTGTGQAIGSHKHFLIATAAYSETTAAPDAPYSAGISDAANVVLNHSTTTVDALCFSYDATTALTLTTCATPFTCEGAPVGNPHNNTTTGVSATDVSLERKPGGAGGNGVDNNVNATDFAISASPAVPHDLASAAVP
ncbi:MAG: hypothetical protein ABI183_01635 [Polyangiaceae bacterium]